MEGQEHEHTFYVDSYCDCGTKLSDYVRMLRARLAARNMEIGRLEARLADRNIQKRGAEGGDGP